MPPAAEAQRIAPAAALVMPPAAAAQRIAARGRLLRCKRRELEAVASRYDWNVVGVFEDAGISGARGRDQRPGLDDMMKVVARREVDMVAAWSVDRLGRSLIDLPYSTIP